MGGWCERIENTAISAFNLVEVEVEAELGNDTINQTLPFWFDEDNIYY